MEKRKENTKRKLKRILGILGVSISLLCVPATIGRATDTSTEQEFRELYLKLLETGDNSEQDISDLELPYMTCYSIMNDVKRNEGFIAYQCYNDYNLIKVDQMDTISGVPYLSKFHMSQTDEGFEERYLKVKEMINTVDENLDDKMTDLDKTLWIHEYVVENIYYLNKEMTENHMGGPTLTNGYGVCEGYAAAMMIFLKAENIPCETISGGAHEWVAVKIEGEWYQVDPTWDDTVANSYGTHYFFLRNDEEFAKTLTKKHAEKIHSDILIDENTDKVSTSTKYTNWYIHDVWNKMHYYDGYWYYVADNSIKKNNIQGTAESVLYEGTNLKITGIEEDTLQFTCKGETQELELIKEIVSEVPTLTPTKEVTKAPMLTPTKEATKVPTLTPTTEATTTPTITPTTEVTKMPMLTPTKEATKTPTLTPTKEATKMPTLTPTKEATKAPTLTPTKEATKAPLLTPTKEVTKTPTLTPTSEATKVPTLTPTKEATKMPTLTPTKEATKAPTLTPTKEATKAPLLTPTKEATLTPTSEATKVPTLTPTKEATKVPTTAPSIIVTKPTTTPLPIATKRPTPTPKAQVTKAAKIKVGKPVIKSVTNKKGKKIKVALKKKVSGAKGYEAVYSTDKKFKKSVKKVRFTGKTKTIGKLKKNKTYYVKVRAYKKNSEGKRIYGAYSKVKKVKIKK